MEIEVFLWILVFLVLIYVAGFVVAIPLYIFLYMKVKSKDKLSISLVFSVISCMVHNFFFIQLLHVPFYEGIIADKLL